MKRRLLARLFGSAAIAAALGVALLPPAGARDWKKLRIGVEGASYPPFSIVGPDGRLSGFDIDIAQALCAKLQAECTLVTQDFDGMIPALQARKFDAVVASMSITPERMKQVLFSDKYYSTPARLVAKAGTVIDGSPASLRGRKIGVQRSTIHDRYATEQFKTAQVVRYTKQEEVFLDLAAGRIDASLADSVAVDVGFLKTPAGRGFGFTGPAYDDPAYFGVGAGIAMRKSDVDLKARLDAAIAAIRADGTYRKIQDKYFAFDVYGDPKQGVGLKP